MAKASVAFIASALFVLVIAGSVHCRSNEVVRKLEERKEFRINITGTVLCSPCRHPIGFGSNRALPGALVKLDCRNPESKPVNGEGVVERRARTDENGKYEFSASGVYETYVCRVDLVHSPDVRCNYLPISGQSCTLQKIYKDKYPFECKPDLMFWPEKADPKCIDELNRDST